MMKAVTEDEAAAIEFWRGAHGNDDMRFADLETFAKLNEVCASVVNFGRELAAEYGLDFRLECRMDEYAVALVFERLGEGRFAGVKASLKLAKRGEPAFAAMATDEMRAACEGLR